MIYVTIHQVAIYDTKAKIMQQNINVYLLQETPRLDTLFF